MRGLVAVVVGALLLIAAGYWLRSTDEQVVPTAATINEGDSTAEPPTVSSADALPTVDAADSSADVETATNEAVQVFRDDTPAQLLADIAAFERLRDPRADAARQRIVARGPGEMPAVMAALEDVVTHGGTLAQQNHLMLVAAQLGDPRYADALINIAAKIPPENILSGSIYDALDLIGAPEKGDRFAADVIANSASSAMQLATALARYWHATPPEIASQASQHTDDPSFLIRALAYRLAVNGGLVATVRSGLENDVSGIRFGEPGNVTALNVLAAIEPQDEFAQRLSGLRLRPDVRRSALLMSEFSWANAGTKTELLPRMLASDTSEIRSTAIAHILKQSRSDLLREYGLADLGPDPAATNQTIRIPPQTRKVADRLGFTIVANGDSIDIQADAE